MCTSNSRSMSRHIFAKNHPKLMAKIAESVPSQILSRVPSRVTFAESAYWVKVPRSDPRDYYPLDIPMLMRNLSVHEVASGNTWKWNMECSVIPFHILESYIGRLELVPPTAAVSRRGLYARNICPFFWSKEWSRDSWIQIAWHLYNLL